MEMNSDSMRAYIINTGELHNDINTSFALATHATRDNPDPKAVWYTDPTYAVLIHHPSEGWILYDTGSAPDSNETWPKTASNSCYYTPVEGATMIEQLDLLGLTPKDINHVVLSHMHIDHMGNIRLFCDTADVWVARKDAEAAFCSVMSSTDDSKHGFYSRHDVLSPIKNLHYIDEDGELFPGIDCMIFPGHTPGVLGLIVHMRTQNIMLVGDALNAQRSFDGDVPGTIWSTLDWRKSLAKIKKLKKATNATIWFGHDIDQFRSFKKIPEYYE